MAHSLEDIGKEKGIKLVHLNIRSLLNEIDQLRIVVQGSGLDIITLSETWMQGHLCSQLVDISGYSMIRQDRDFDKVGKKRGGGLVTYIHSTKFPEFRSLDKLSTSSKNVEAQWLEICRPNCKNIVICNMYRPPNANL